MDGLPVLGWEKKRRAVQIFAGFDRHVRFSLLRLLLPFFFFFEPKSRFHITPQIYIIRGRETVINKVFRRCGPVKIDCHVICHFLNLAT